MTWCKKWQYLAFFKEFGTHCKQH